jgi:hypothetical protein
VIVSPQERDYSVGALEVMCLAFFVEVVLKGEVTYFLNLFSARESGWKTQVFDC